MQSALFTGAAAAADTPGNAVTSAVAEPHAAELLRELVGTRNAILRAGAAADSVFVTVWDFDGTILDGDCTDDHRRGGELVYPGLARLAIEAGLAKDYPSDGGIDTFWAHWTWLDDNVGSWLSYPYLIQAFRGAEAEALSQLTANAFDEHLQSAYFVTSVALIHGLRAAGIESWVISASPERFVRGAAKSLGIPAGNIHGIRVVEEDGRLTERLIYPVTRGEGKRERLQELIAARAVATPIYVIGGFGDSYGSDGPMLAEIAAQALPAGEPLTVMINGGDTPHEYAGRFRQVSQMAVVGPE